MRKTFLTACMLLLCGLWAVAQQQSDPSQSSQPTSSSQATSSASETTIQGCLSGSSGSYTLADKSSGNSYQLTGNTAKLSSHVGHEIQVTGTASQPSAASSSGAASPSAAAPASGAAGPQTFEVKSFKHIAATCGSSSGTQPTPPLY